MVMDEEWSYALFLILYVIVYELLQSVWKRFKSSGPT